MLSAIYDLDTENWAAIASLIENWKLSGGNSQAYRADVLREIVNRTDSLSIGELRFYNWIDCPAPLIRLITEAGWQVSASDYKRRPTSSTISSASTIPCTDTRP